MCEVTDRALLELVEVGFEDVELDALVVAVERDAANQEDDEHDIREDGREIDDLTTTEYHWYKYAH